jgi:hypothetical protein
MLKYVIARLEKERRKSNEVTIIKLENTLRVYVHFHATYQTSPIWTACDDFPHAPMRQHSFPARFFFHSNAVKY